MEFQWCKHPKISLNSFVCVIIYVFLYIWMFIMNLCNDIGYAFIKIVIITKSFVVGQCFHSCYKCCSFI